LTINYRKKLFDGAVEDLKIGVLLGFRECYYIDLHNVDFDRAHVHLLCRFCPSIRGPGGTIGQDHHIATPLQGTSVIGAGTMELGVFDGWLLYFDD